MSRYRTTRALAKTLHQVFYRATSHLPTSSISGERLYNLPLQRGLITNAEGNGPPKVLITGGLGQLGSGLAKVLRYVHTMCQVL